LEKLQKLINTLKVNYSSIIFYSLKNYKIYPTLPSSLLFIMAATKLNKAVDAFTKTHSIEAIDSFQAFLGEKVELDAEWLEYFEEYKKQIAAEKAVKTSKVDKVAKTDKPKRAPTAYNIYVAEQMAALKESQPDLSAKDRMKTAAGMWKAHDAAVAPLASVEEDEEVNTPV